MGKEAGQAAGKHGLHNMGLFIACGAAAFAAESGLMRLGLEGRNTGTTNAEKWRQAIAAALGVNMVAIPPFLGAQYAYGHLSK
jgi:hypothetical protein